MKKTLLLSALLIALISLCKPERARAQITGVTLNALDSTYYTSARCFLPSTDGFLMYGSVTGTYTTADSLSFYVNFDDGYDSSFKIVAAASYYISINHVYTLPGTYTPYETLTATGGATVRNVDPAYTLSNSCAQIYGKEYIDANLNCIPDPGEIGLSYVPIILVDNTTHDTTFGGWTNDTGYYAFTTPTAASYTVISAPFVFGYWWSYYYSLGYGSNIYPECPASGDVSLSVTGGSTYAENFGDTCTTPDSVDVSAYGWSGCYTPGDSTYIEVWAGDWWWWYDFTCTSLSSTVTLTLDPHVTYTGAGWGMTPTSVSGSTITWDYSSSSSIFSFYSVIKVVVSTSATIGDTLCSTLYASPTSVRDPNLSNNTASLCRIVSASYDPNGKAVSPQGDGVPGYIDNNTPLSYQIHFQNTGTAAASNITIVDTLSPNVDPRSLHVLQSSAPVQIYTSGNLVKFMFANINLPDSTSNPWGSIGYVSYAVMPKPDLAPGTQIWNTSAVYFDYNRPVQTNSTLNTIRTTTGVSKVNAQGFIANVFPNPAENQVTATTADKSNFTITITDLLGQVVAKGISMNGSATIGTQALPTGLYIVKLVNTAGKENTSKLSIEH